jgi:hypothetical protein
MLKRLVVLACALTFTGPAMSAQNEATGEKQAQKSQSDPRDSSHPPVTVTNNQSGTCGENSLAKPQGWHTFLTWPEGITAWFIIFTFGAIVWQSNETRRAANAAKDSVLTQEAAYQQWIDLRDWQSAIIGENGEILNISFKVSNPTAYLLKAEHGEVTFSNPKRIMTFIYRPAPLTPANPVTVELPITIQPETTEAFQAGSTIGFPVTGSITFVSALGRRITQEFTGIITCNLKETKFEARVDLGDAVESPISKHNQIHKPN